MAITEQLKFLIGVKDDASGKFEAIGRSADKNLGKADTKTQQLSSSMTKFGAVAVASSGIVFGALYKAAGAYGKAQAQADKLSNSINNSGKFTQGAAKRLDDLAQGLQKVTAADGDAIVGAESLLVQFGLTETQIKQVTPLVVDLSRKMGIDLDSAAKLVGKSIEGSSGALKKAGIIVDATRAKTDAYGATVDALKSTVGGYARQEGATFAGQMERLKNQLGDVEESIGKGAVPVLSQMAGIVGKAAEGFNTLNDSLGGNIGKFLAYGAAATGVVGVTSLIGGQLVKLGSYAKSAVRGVTSVAQAFTNLKAATTTAGGFAEFGATAGVAAVGIGVLAGALIGYEQNQKEATARKNEWIAALSKEKGAVEQASNDLIAHAFATKSIGEAMDKTSVSAKDLADFIQGKNVPAINDMRKVVESGSNEWRKYGSTQEEARRNIQQVLAPLDAQRAAYRAATGELKSNAETTKRQNAIVAELGDTTKKVTGRTDEQNAALQKVADLGLKAYADGTKKAVDASLKAYDAGEKLAASQADLEKANRDAAVSEDLASLSLIDLTTATTDAQTAADAYKTSLDTLAGNFPTVEKATVDYKQAIADATAALKDQKGNLDTTKKGLDDNTQAGRDNLTALGNIADKAIELQGAQDKAGASTAQLSGLMVFQRADFIKTAEQMGATKAQAEDLANKYGLIPKNVPTAVKQVGIEQVRTKLDQLRSDISQPMLQYINSLVAQGKLDEANRILDGEAKKTRTVLFYGDASTADAEAELAFVARNRTSVITATYNINTVTSGGPGFKAPPYPGGFDGNPATPYPRAAGGPVKAGEPYVVGDGGRPELFVPEANGKILPRVPSGGDTYIDNRKTTFILPTGADPARWAREQRRYQRRNGS